MKYCRFLSGDGPRYGSVEDRSGRLWITAPTPSPFPNPDQPASFVPNSDHSFQPVPLSEVELLPPVTPSKIICVGRNYRDHAKELGNEIPAQPLLFLKPPSSLLSPGGTILLPKASERVDFEGEVAVVVARRARYLRPDEDLDPYLHGYTIANDVTARDLQKKDGQWARAKGYDTFCPVGPVVDTELDPSSLTLQTHVNGELRQQGSTADFIFNLPYLLAYITAAMTLEPGDLLLTGTPAGVGPLAPGDQVSVSIAGLGVLTNLVAADPQGAVDPI